MITAQLATIPERAKLLPQVIDSLCKQVDVLYVMLNNWGVDLRKEWMTQQFLCWPGESLKWGNVIFIDRKNEKSDGEKHYNIENAASGYVFTVDDDILYPKNYVEYMISKIEQYERKAVITCHGRVFGELPIHSFYRDRAAMYQCLSTVVGDHKVDCGGDGVMAWHTDTFAMRYEYVELPDMSQLWVALACNRMGVPQICVEHQEGWLQYLEPERYGATIWDKHNVDDSVQTNLVNTRWIKR